MVSYQSKYTTLCYLSIVFIPSLEQMVGLFRMICVGPQDSSLNHIQNCGLCKGARSWADRIYANRRDLP